MNPLVKLRPWRDKDGREGERLYLWCPGCDDLHAVEVKAEPVRWDWNHLEDVPTINPSILVNGGQGHPRKPVCHSFVRQGQWEFLSDSTHELAGQTVPMVPLPDFIVRPSDGGSRP